MRDHSKRAERTRNLEQGFLDAWKSTGVSNFFKQRQRELRKRRVVIFQQEITDTRRKTAPILLALSPTAQDREQALGGFINGLLPKDFAGQWQKRS